MFYLGPGAAKLILENSRTHVKINLMEKQFSASSFQSVNGPSIQRHHRDKFWQILFPLILGVLLILGMAVIVVLTATRSTAGGSVSQWADASLLWLILPVMMIAIFGIVVLLGLIYLVAKLINILPTYTNLVQVYAELIAGKVSLVTRKILSPFVNLSSTNAGVKGFFSALFGKSRH